VALFALNALICWPLFSVEYLNDFQSNEGSYITFAHFLRQYWPHIGWFPWFNAGMPFEDTYLPLPAFLAALGALLGRTSPAHAFHFIAALAYSLGPVFLFLFARRHSGRMAPSAWAALLWSLFSPAVILFPELLADMGTVWGIKRLKNIVFYGETPHNLALCLLPLSLLLTMRFLDAPSMRRFAVAVVGVVAVMIANAFGVVVVLASTLILLAVREKLPARSLLAAVMIFPVAYLCICRLLPPTLIVLLEKNSQLVGGDYRFTLLTAVTAGVFLVLLIVLWAFSRRFCSPTVQFAVLFSVCFIGITWLGFHRASFLPQPERYHIEAEVGPCLLVPFLLNPLTLHLSRKTATLCAALSLIALSWIAVKDYRFARKLIRPIDIAQTLPYEEASWVATNLPDQRVMDASDGLWLFNLFASNPQMGGGHEPSAPNWMQRVAVYTIFTGENAGDQDGPISILWLKTFGCGAIVVPGLNSQDRYHAIRNPSKFDGILPLVWRHGGDSVYRVPLRSTSLAHVIPRSAAVARTPVNGLDIEPLRPYLDALDDVSMPLAALDWEDPDHGTITARLDRSEVVSVQVTYDPGWRARVGGHTVSLQPDRLGFMQIDPECLGDCTVELEFTGGLERKVTLVLSLLFSTAILAFLIAPTSETDSRLPRRNKS
jgi:hypothetical protein